MILELIGDVTHEAAQNVHTNTSKEKIFASPLQCIVSLCDTAVKPLEYQVEYRALEQSLNITM